jgi:hypothetical protein
VGLARAAWLAEFGPAVTAGLGARLCRDGRHWLILEVDVRSCREVSVNSGGEPERDDTGLPPVDIEIPDDARDLDRDVQAYFRELRAERRRLRRRRLHGGLARDGVVLPLLACCLILALITGTLLTVFTATSDQNLVNPLARGTSPNSSSPPTATTSRPTSSSASSGAGRTAAAPGLTTTVVQRHDVRLVVDQKPRLLRSMFGAMLVLIPPRCDHCTTTIIRLTRMSIRAGTGTVLVGTPGTITEAKQIQSRLSRRIARHVQVALDGQGVLHNAVSAGGLTAVVMSEAPAGGESLAYASNLTASDLTATDSPLSAALIRALGH